MKVFNMEPPFIQLPTVFTILSLVSSVFSCDHLCILGYQFCETGKGICRNCEDYRDHCFVDNKHISNCSTYCTESVPDTATVATYTNGAPWTLVYVLISLLVLAVVFNVLQSLYICIKPRRNSSSSSSTGTSTSGSEFSSSTTVSYTKNDIDKDGQTVSLLGHSEKKQPNLIQISNTNDRIENSKLLLSGKKSDSNMVTGDTACKLNIDVE